MRPDAGTLDASASLDAARTDAAIDAGVVEASADDSGSVDGGGCADRYAQCARPPASFTRCGGGAIDPAGARAACDSLNPPSDLGVGLMKACAAFTIVGGHYEVWCGAGEVYVWTSFDTLASSDVLECSFTVPLPDGGTVTGTYDQLSWGLRDANNQLYARVALTGAGTVGGLLLGGASPYSPSDVAMDASHWAGSVAFDGRLWVGVGGTGGTGALFYTAAQTDCDAVPTATGFRVVLAVPVTWGG